MIRSAICTSFKHEVLDGLHGADDVYRMALFTVDAELGADTTKYERQSGEVKGRGYTAGGIALTGHTTGIVGTGAYLTFNDPQWVGASFTARGGLIYNSSQSNRAVAVLNFGKDETCSNGNFQVGLPEAGADAIVHLS